MRAAATQTDRYVEAWNRFLFKGRSAWTEQACFDFDDMLSGIPAENQEQVIDLVRAVGLRPKMAMQVLRGWCSLDPERRDQFYASAMAFSVSRKDRPEAAAHLHAEPPLQGQGGLVGLAG